MKGASVFVKGASVAGRNVDIVGYLKKVDNLPLVNKNWPNVEIK